MKSTEDPVSLSFYSTWTQWAALTPTSDFRLQMTVQYVILYFLSVVFIGLLPIYRTLESMCDWVLDLSPADYDSPPPPCVSLNPPTHGHGTDLQQSGRQGGYFLLPRSPEEGPVVAVGPHYLLQVESIPIGCINLRNGASPVWERWLPTTSSPGQAHNHIVKLWV